ncbi:MAG: NUDIX pyrophosphatase [Cellvibrionaceae bacterium]|nr:NUDIX pyrophosphatase [Cellvibrionaceae bacterium]
MRGKYQVLVLPYRVRGGEFEYALFKRSDEKYWQPIAGGSEDDETPIEAAQRESLEEAGIQLHFNYLYLDSRCTIPVVNVCGFLWGNDCLLVEEHCFGVRCQDIEMTLSDEHQGFEWFSYDTAMTCLKWDSNRNALWELNYRLKNNIDL